MFPSSAVSASEPPTRTAILKALQSLLSKSFHPPNPPRTWRLKRDNTFKMAGNRFGSSIQEPRLFMFSRGEARQSFSTGIKHWMAATCFLGFIYLLLRSLLSDTENPGFAARLKVHACSLAP